ncbi:MAG: zinc-binding dehydrogenase [Gammaproteobacteria bacterium]|nr:zinc-binding dehydrogenase [Gammaproteobacteria bacterium]
MGGHARYVNVPGVSAVKKPGNLSFEEASSLPVIFLTVYHAFELANLKEGEHILIQTAAGGCGLMAVQLANLHQSIIYGTSSRDEKLSRLKQIGVNYGLNYTQDFDETIRAITHNRGVDVVLNMLGGAAIQKGLNVLAPGGRYLELAVHGLKASAKLDLSRLVHNQAFYSIDGRQTAGIGNPNLVSGYLSRMVEMVEKEEICPVVHKIYPLSQIQEALQYVESGAHIGKVVISHSQEQVIDLTEKCLKDLAQQKERSRHRKVIQPHSAQKRMADSHPVQDDIAIIGMSGRFPDAGDVAEFWENLSTGLDSIQAVPPERWDTAHPTLSDLHPSDGARQWAGLLADIDQFDPLFFNISPREAELMDPQQRLFLEETWKAIEDAGYSPKRLAGQACGVFVGVGSGDYARIMPELTAQSLTGNAPSILASRIAYFMDLAGPCVAIDTACTSSLSAIHLACQSLLNGDCNLALAGGVHIMTTSSLQVMTDQMGILSPTGQCRTFDASANGWVMSEGVGVVVLKPVSKAIEDKDHIYGIIKSSGFNQNGSGNGLTAPKSAAQSQLQQKVYQKGEINPETIDYVEVQGVSSSLGDAIEINALKESFSAFTTKQNFCALGLFRPSVGHPFTASGIDCFI